MTSSVDRERILARIEPLCEAFEDEQAHDAPPSIEAYLSKAASQERSVLLEELLALELHFERARGHSPDMDAYVRRFPDSSPTIARVFASAGIRANVDPMRLNAGTAMGPYTIRREIGRGGMGVVYEARHDLLDRIVALKLLPAHEHENEMAELRFQREARAIAKLHHGNIVPVFDFGTLGGVHFFAMQLIEGESLAEAVRRWRKAGHDPLLKGHLKRLLRQMADIARALQFAHDRGVVHRDVKPSNILLDDQGAPWLVDFGVAHIEESDLTTADDLLGTIRYMPPERFNGQSSVQDDVYALGVTLFEALTLKPVFEESDPAILIHHIVSRRPRRLREQLPHASRDLETVIATAMAPEPSRRYDSAGSFAADLERILRDVPVKARRTSALERAWRWSRRNRAATAALAFLMLFAMTATAMSVALNQRNQRITNLSSSVSDLLDDSEIARKALRSELYRADMDRVAKEIFSDRGTHVSPLLNRWAPGTDSSDLRGWEWHMLRSCVARDEELIRFRGKSGGAIAWCPVTRQLAVGGTGGIRLIDLDTRETVTEFDGFSYTRSIDFDREGRRLLVSEMSGLRVIDIASGDVLAKHKTRRFQPASWLDGGPRALILTPDPTIWDVDKSQLEPVKGLRWTTEAARASEDGSMVASPLKSGGVELVSLEDSRLIAEIDVRKTAPEGLHRRIKISPDGSMLAASTRGGGVSVWRIPSGEVVLRWNSERVTDVSALSWSRDGVKLAVSSTKAGLQVWNVETGASERILRGHFGDVRGVAFVDEDRTLVSVDQTGDMRSWDLEAPPGYLRLDGRAGTGSMRTLRLQWSPIGDEVAVTAPHQRSNWRVDGAIPTHLGTEPFRISKTSPDGTMDLVYGADRVSVIDRSTGKDLFEGLTGAPFESALRVNKRCNYVWSADSQRVYSLNRGYSWVYRDLKGSVVAEEFLKEYQFGEVDFDPERELFALSVGREMLVVDEHSLEIVERLEPQGVDPLDTNPIVPAFGPPGSPLAFGWGPRLFLFDATSFEFTSGVQCYSDTILSLQWNPDGNRLAVTTRGGGIRIIDPVEGLVVTLSCLAEVSELAWSPDGTRLAALDASGHWHMWDARHSLDQHR